LKLETQIFAEKFISNKLSFGLRFSLEKQGGIIIEETGRFA
jgi:hypothetical protein